jgi:ribose transport system permease protein
VTSFVERSGVPLLLVVLAIFFAVNPTTGELFRSAANLQNIFGNQSVTGLIALGMVVPLVAGYFDISVAAICGLASVTFASLSGTYHLPVGVGIVGALLVSLIAGVINATLVAVLRLNAFIITFGTYVLFGGLLQLYTGGSTVGNGLPPSLNNWGTMDLLGVALPTWLLLLIALVLWYVLAQTPFGRQLDAIGSNETAARLAGFRVDRALVITFLASGLFGGLAGCVLTSRTLIADSTTAQSYIFPALAAVFLGQTAIRPGKPNVWGTIFGVFLVAVAVNGLTLFGASSWVSAVFNGAALVISVALSTFIARGRETKARAALLHDLRASQAATTHPTPTKDHVTHDSGAPGQR